MQEQVRLLVELQKVDVVLGGMKRKMEEVPRRLSVIEEEMGSLKTELDKERADLEDMKKDRRTKEGLLQMEIERVKRSEDRLKEIKTQKEYHALLKEIEQGKKLNAEREEDILRLISGIEEKERSIREREDTLGVKEGEYSEERKTLEEELSRIDAEFDTRKKDWEEISKNIRPDILRLYKRVLERRPDMAIVPAKNGACSGCHMGLPPQLYNQVQKGAEMHQCPSCYRILYWEGSNS